MTKAANNIQVLGSFRDPSGFLFWQGGALYRQVNVIYREEYDYLMNSGLYEVLVSSGLLLPHEEVIASLSRLPLSLMPMGRTAAGANARGP